jgi:nucleoid-associated protein YgaU
MGGLASPRAGGAHRLAWDGLAPGAQEPDGRVSGRPELHVREVRVRELHVSEFRAGERQAAGTRARRVRGREVRSVTVRARAVRGAVVRHAVVRHAVVRRAVVRGAVGVRGTEARQGAVRTGLRRDAGPGKPGAARAGQLRLTRRGRTVVAALAIVMVTAVATAMLFWLGATGGAQAASHRAGPGAAHRGLSQVVVQPGQTLWSIARRAEPAADPRGVVQQIIEANAMGSPTIQAGQLLWVPRG